MAYQRKRGTKTPKRVLSRTIPEPPGKGPVPGPRGGHPLDAVEIEVTSEMRAAALKKCGAAARAVTAADAKLEETVICARAYGLAWDSIAFATGVNPETLRRRYAMIAARRLGFDRVSP